MHVTEIGQGPEHVAVKNLDATAGIRCSVLQQRPPDRVRNSRRQQFDGAVFPLRAPTGYHGDSGSGRLEFRQQRRKIGRVILPIAVERADYSAIRHADLREDGGALATALRVAQRPQASIVK